MEFEERITIRKDIGMLFQKSALFDSMTVDQNVKFPLEMLTEMSYNEKVERVNYCLDRVNLTDRNKLYPAEPSAGMKKRIGIARATSMTTKSLFVDEPNS